MTDGADSEPATTEELPTEPLISADQLCLRTHRGWVFQDVDLHIPAGSVTALAGPSGSGRSMLLLTLAGRARPTSGRLTVAGQTDRPGIRRAVAVARVTGAAELEPDLRVVDHIREAQLLNRHSFDYPWAREVLGLDADPTSLVADLPTDDAVLLSVALVLAARPPVIVVDDVDIAASIEQQTRIWRAFGNTSTTVIATTVDGIQAGKAGATVVSMGGRH
jgi:ABC-type multidrug transport system ATPase subunit